MSPKGTKSARRHANFMITLTPTRLHWLNDDGDDPADLCAHSPVLLEVHGTALVTPKDGDVTVSAAAVFLLRTLERDHTPEQPVGDQLFPCCGHAMFDTGDDDVVICGCNSGPDLSVVHEEMDQVQLTSPNGQTVRVALVDWQEAVIHFCDQVTAFYDAALPKRPTRDDSGGFEKMMAEWRRRRQQSERKRNIA
ncbi:MAG: hypothetical protein NXI04_18115 [Planctomycetaceae bacterium]|nr:hypothetical protein [Planctomycetaceae bacterium]